MPLPVIADTVRVVVRGTLANGAAWQNTWHWRNSTITSTTLANLKATLQKLYTGPNLTSPTAGGVNWAAGASTPFTVTDMTFTPLDGVSASTVLPVNVTAGQASPVMMPSEVAFVLTLRTTLRGRSHRGRIYMPALDTNQLNANGTLKSATITGFLAQFTNVVAEAGVNSWTPAVASYLLHTASSVSTATMDAIADVQRRRKI